MSEVKHTPTPWKIHEHDGESFLNGVGKSYWQIDGPQHAICNNRDCAGSSAEQKANAAFIVKAVNSYEKLVAALQNIMNGISTGAIKSDYDETMEQAVIQAHNALTLAAKQS